MHSSCFYEWQHPERLAESAELMRTQLAGLSMRGPGKDFREAFVAAKFAKVREADAVKLLQTRHGTPTPDFAIRMGTNELWFETTEADRLGRKRGAEDQAPGVREFLESEWVTASDYHSVVCQRVQTKTQKSYDKCDGLIVWSNAFPLADPDELTADWWCSAVTSAEGVFGEVWVHHSGAFTQLI